MGNNMKILVTGTAGFIGFHLSRKLCELGNTVTGIDNLNDYYDVLLKEARLNEMEPYAASDQFHFIKADISELKDMESIFKNSQFDMVIHLAAQAGVRYSLENPHAYVQSNIVGFMNILECCRHSDISNMIYASSSSVYGGNTKLPFSETDRVDDPASMYAVTKRSNELMAGTYAELYGLNTIGLRFFTVYGPWGRPDMALFKFTKNIIKKLPIPLYNHGQHRRSFTYIDDIIECMIRLIDRTQNMDGQTGCDQIYNIGGESSIELMDYVHEIERALGEPGIYENLPLQLGDVIVTQADSGKLEDGVGYSPSTSIQEGIKEFVSWYRGYYNK